MATTQSMETVAARLETFTPAQAKAKKRASNAKGAKGTKWPHKSPSPAQLAQAGFYFKPTSSSPDNVQCFFCRKDVDGWEAEDDPAKEHVALSPECGWATQIALEQEDESGDLRTEDPMSERMIEARKATFADMWPHERKRGWTCKVQKMVEAGWYYYPTPESDDYAKCAYCGLCLDGWEPKDKPL
ncbi:MAG: hypothetical protein LQ340_000500 [Diploschistes diacapsis]|nr:MAG: hypothetical protein LQ340_000500 [Diploschistes diacapsis]